MNHDLYNFHTLVPSNTSSASSFHQLRVSSSLPVRTTIPIHPSFAIRGMQGNVIGLLATVGFATPVRFAAGSIDGKPALTGLPRGNASLGHPLPAEKNASDTDPWLSSSFDCVHSSSGFASQAWFLVPVCYVPGQVPVVGTQRPVGPVCVFPHSHIPMVVGYCSVIHLQTIWLPFLHSTISKCPAGLPQALSPVIRLPIFFLGSMVILQCYVTRVSLHSRSCPG